MSGASILGYPAKLSLNPASVRSAKALTGINLEGMLRLLRIGIVFCCDLTLSGAVGFHDVLIDLPASRGCRFIGVVFAKEGQHV